MRRLRPRTSAIAPQASITVVIGRAVPSASRLTAAAASAAQVDCMRPSMADALPARSPHASIAAAVALGRTTPIEETPATMANITAPSPAPARTATASAA